MGACYSTASSYSTWLCGYGERPLAEFSYTDMNGDPINIDELLSDDELLGLDESAGTLRRADRRGVLSWIRHGTSPITSADVASPYGNRQLIVHSDHFNKSELSDGLDTSSGESSSAGHCYRDPSRACSAGSAAKRGNSVHNLHTAAHNTADVVMATQKAMESLSRYRFSDSGCADTTSPTSTTAADSSFDDDVIGDCQRHHPVHMSTPCPAQKQQSRPAMVSRETDTSMTSPRLDLDTSVSKLTSLQELTAWIDDPDELRSLNYSDTTESVGQEDFEEFLNSVVAKSLTGQYPPATGATCRAGEVSGRYPSTTPGYSSQYASTSATVAEMSAESTLVPLPQTTGCHVVAQYDGDGGVVSDSDEYGLVVGAGGQIVPARYAATTGNDAIGSTCSEYAGDRHVARDAQFLSYVVDGDRHVARDAQFLSYVVDGDHASECRSDELASGQSTPDLVVPTGGKANISVAAAC